MLEDSKWRKKFHEKNLTLMAESYGVITHFMQEHHIPYYEMNAGLYLWTDCRRFLVSSAQRTKVDFTDLRVGGLHDDTYKRRETRVVEIDIESGVLISPGTIYEARDYGWFRVTFTAERPMLEEGLRRLVKVLNNQKITN